MVLLFSDYITFHNFLTCGIKKKKMVDGGLSLSLSPKYTTQKKKHIEDVFFFTGERLKFVSSSVHHSVIFSQVAKPRVKILLMVFTR